MRWTAITVFAAACSFEPQLETKPASNPDAAGAPDAAVTLPPDMAPPAAGCPIAYAAAFGTHRYRLTDKDYSWPAARDQCQSDGGHLVKIETREEDNFLTGAVDGGDHPFIWVGLADPTSTDTYQWTDGSALGTFDHFTFGVIPTSSDNCIDKSASDFDGRWFAFDCNRQQRGVCECDG